MFRPAEFEVTVPASPELVSVSMWPFFGPQLSITSREIKVSEVKCSVLQNQSQKLRNPRARCWSPVCEPEQGLVTRKQPSAVLSDAISLR